jgi:putative ATPase
MELFKDNKSRNLNLDEPLPQRIRPIKMEDVIGQESVIEILKKYIESDFLPSIIFWGSPGTGKTTLANIIANEFKAEYFKLSAVDSGIKDLRKIIEKAEHNYKISKKSILFIDEIHRFNKSQQDSLLHAVESGILILIGATTENPSFEVNHALLSRMKVYKLRELNEKDIETILINAIKNDNKLNQKEYDIENINNLIQISGGDARSALKNLELVFNYQKTNKKISFNSKLIEKIIDKKIINYDKKGESHYDTISAFIKSMRGSDPDAAIFWLAKMVEAGEDPKFIARRMVIFASEDIGNADPTALILATSVFDAVNLIGYPECMINLAQGVTYLASAPKSNASYKAIKEAMSDLKKGINDTVPMHLRNAPTSFMQKEGYGKDYQYPHDFPNNFVNENYMPEKSKKQYYIPTKNGREAKINERLNFLWSNQD